jgi:uncharacterized protein YwqG
MTMSAAEEDLVDLATLSVAELAQAYVASVQARQSTDHVGRENRLANRSSAIVQVLNARGELRRVLEDLAHHADAEVQKQARAHLASLAEPPAATVPAPAPLNPKQLWQCDHPPPPGLTRDEISARLRQSVPEHSDALTELIRPAIGLWPQRRSEVTATTSRFGGRPIAPPGWQWTVGAADEPRVFVGQIDCAALRGLPGAELLPAAGLIAFFSDYEAAVGASSFDSDCVFYWPHVERLVPVEAAIEPIETFPACALLPRPLLDLPHPDSSAVGALDLNKQQRAAYFDVWLEVSEHGVPSDCVRYAGFSKLFGWPAFLQNDLEQFSASDARLLLQANTYCNGERSHDWGTGGTLFYVLRERDLRARNFARCELEGQFP